MEGRTHVLGAEAACLGLTVPGIYRPETLVAAGGFFIAAGIGALLPDIDTKHSTVSNEHRVTSFFTRLFFTHRGFTHSLLACGILYVLGMILTGFFPVLPVVNGLALGVLSHILLDMLNPMGVCLFFPWKKKISVGKIRTGGLFEKLFFLCLVVLCGYLIFRMVQPYIAGLSFPVIKERFIGLFQK